MSMTRRIVLSLTAAATPGLVLAAAKTSAVSGGPTMPPLLGKPSAPKRFVVWGSYSCPYTALLMPILKALQAEGPDLVSVEWRNFPLHPMDPAQEAAALSLKGEAFWTFSFQAMAAYLQKTSPLDDKEFVALIVANGGSEATVQRAYADPSKWAAIRRDLVAGQLMGVKGTPGLFINGYFLTPGGLPTDTKAFARALNDMVFNA